MLSANVNGLGGQYKNFQEGIVTIARAHKIFREVPEKYDDPSAVEIIDCRGQIKFKQVVFSYEKQKVLDGISFNVEAGQMVAIVGKSGEGKSTLVDLLSRYIIPNKGAILLDGTDIRKFRLRSLRRQIAIVPQETVLFNDTIKNNIGYSKLDATDEEIMRAAEIAHCHEFIEKFPKKYAQIVGEKGVKLSVGQKQRVAIARAVLRDPKILILDEATSALDSESEKFVQEALGEIMKNRTTFVIAHRLSTIRKADLILVLESGKIVESGDHQELINHGGIYKKLSELQQISV
jgi:subfamily B ATP-binding cassette protein MsbA